MGEEIIALEREYNAQNGFGEKDDFLPDRFFTDEGSSGEGIDVPALDRARFTEELERYYRIRSRK
jgi:aldehyde:ferredoxin oxidoreductase